MSDIIERLRQRLYPYRFTNLVAAGGNLCNAAPAVVQPAQTGVFTVGGPDKDMQEAIAEIERLRALVVVAAKFRDEFRREFYCHEAVVKARAGWVDGFDLACPVDAAYLELAAALDSQSAIGKKS